MGLKLVKSWRGVVRGNLKDAQGDLTSLVHYQAKHPTYDLFTPAEVTQVEATVAILAAKIAATRLR